MKPIQLKNYTDPAGKCRFEAWMRSLDNPAKYRIIQRIYRLANGNFGDHRQISEQLYELRMHFGPGYRLYYGLHRADLILLLGGGDKSTQSKDILRARYDWNTYLESRS